MSRRLLGVGTLLFSAFLALGALAQGPARIEPGLAATKHLTQGDVVGSLDAVSQTLQEMRRMGMLVFTTPLNRADGYGDGPFDPDEEPSVVFGHRPTLQGNTLSLRVNGLDAQACNECHSIVSADTRPPTLGIGGVGGIVQNAIIMPTLIDVADSDDDRVEFVPGHDPDLPLVADGVADFNGRFSNPPFLFGGGGVELLAKEMTADLQALLAEARQSPPGFVTPLVTHGVSFGSITTVDSVGNVDLDLEGLGFLGEERSPEEQLVVRPFGRKGEAFTMRDFDRGAMQFHFGIQPVEVVGEFEDEDGDGVVNEVTVAEMTMLHIFDVTNPRPFMEPLTGGANPGFQTFQDIGCAECHRPVIETQSKTVPLAFPEIAEDPAANVYARIDLVTVGFNPVPGGGVEVPFFADLKRHDMGPRLAETFERAEIANEEFTTARLWGVADTAPYLHDGRATTLFEAIEFHGGEAQVARDAFLALNPNQQERLLLFLSKLRVPEDPNVELIQ